jgi:hypothetical protein
MVSQAVASVDAWLARAEQVLQAQQEHGISPSSVPWDDEREEWVITLASFERALKYLLGRLCRRYRPVGRARRTPQGRGGTGRGG